MASNFAEAMQQGYAFGAQQREERERRSKLAELAGLSSKVIGGDYEATNRAYALDREAAKAYQSEGDRRREQLAGMARGWKSVPSEQRQAYYERFIAPAVSQMGFGDLGPYDEAAVDGVATQILAAYGGGTPGGAVQSTYVDAMGNRVAIMRDGSTQVLGQNAPNNQIIDTGNGFFGVNKSSLSAAPVMVGGQPQQVPQPSIQAGLYQTPAGMVRIGEGLTPEQQQAALMDIQGGGAVDSVQLPARDVAPQQFGGGQQLRSAPKAHVPSGYRANPDGSLSMIPGGPAQVAADARADAAAARKAAEDLKASAKAQEAQQRQSESATTAQNLVSAIDTLTRSPGFSSLGTAWGDTQIAIPVIRNDAKDADAQLKNIAGQVAMATLSRLKSLSATGATGFGALSNQELQLIQNSIATLQSERISNAELRRSLKIIRDGMEKVSNWSPTRQPPANEADDIDSLLDMYR
jgi:hypothetical protein